MRPLYLTIFISSFLLSNGSAEAQSHEIIVTAQKRKESIQKVPISVTSFNSETLEKLGVTSLKDLTTFVPNVELFDDRGAGQPTWVIRGAGLADFNSNNTPTAAIYVDEVYLASNVLGGVGLYDLERIEVLKGPQGGLYGRNTTGGAVRVLSNRPHLQDYSGYAQISHGRWNRNQLEGAVGGPLIKEKLAFRLAGSVDQGGGWQDSLTTAENDKHGDKDFKALRGQLLFEPIPELEILLKADIGSDQSETTLGRSTGVYDPLTGDFCSSIRVGQRDDVNCVGLHNLLGNSLLPSEQAENGTTVLANPINTLDNEWAGYNFNVNYDLGFANLTSVSSYIDFNYVQFFDFDATPLELVSSTTNRPDTISDITQYSQDIRITSNQNSPLSWLAGIAYAEDTITQDQGFSIIGLEPIIGLSLISSNFTQDTKSLSIYSNIGYDASKTLNINGSIRYTDENKKIDYSSIGEASGLGRFPLLSNIHLDTDLDKNVSGHLGLNWNYSKNVFLYAKYARGFKSGGFSGAFTDNPVNLSPYQPGTNDSFELGLKFNHSENIQLNLAAFYYDYKNVQGFASIENAIFGNITQLTNLGDAEHFGLEIESYWAPAQLPGFKMQLSAAWLDAKITDSSLQVATQDDILIDIEGLNRSFSPKFSFSADLSQEKKISAHHLVRVSANYNWRDNLADRNSLLSDLDYGLFRQDSYGLLNLNASLIHLDQNWALSFIGENVANEIYTLRSTTDDGGSYQDILGRPVSWKIQVRYNF